MVDDKHWFAKDVHPVVKRCLQDNEGKRQKWAVLSVMIGGGDKNQQRIAVRNKIGKLTYPGQNPNQFSIQKKSEDEVRRV